MTEQDTLDALQAIGLRGEVRQTDHPDYRRVFVIDPDGVTQGRFTILRGAYSHDKWYVRAINSGPVLADERLPWAWRLWTQRSEPLSAERWAAVVQQAEELARAERAEKQAWRDAHPKPGKRARLALKTRSYIARLLLGDATK